MQKNGIDGVNEYNCENEWFAFIVNTYSIAMIRDKTMRQGNRGCDDKCIFTIYKFCLCIIL